MYKTTFKLFLIACLFLSTTICFGQQCSEFQVTLNSQADVDAFPVNNPDCTIVQDLLITGNSITNLNGLSQITEVTGTLTIDITAPEGENYNLTNIDGLNNITTVGMFLNISGIPNVVSNDMFPNLTSLGIDLYLTGLLPEHVNGFHHLTTFENVVVTDTSSLSMNCFSALTTLTGSITMAYNEFTTFTGFNLLSSIDEGNVGTIAIAHNANLIALPNFENLTHVEMLQIQHCHSLQNFQGLESLQTVGYLYIDYNNILENLTGLQNLTSSDNYITLLHNPLLNDISALSNIPATNVLEIRGNTSITTLSAFDNLNLTDAMFVFITDNLNLTTCATTGICNRLAQLGTASVEVYNNGSTCNTAQEIQTTCGIMNVDKNNKDLNIIAYPNPVINILNIDYTGKAAKYSISDVQGRITMSGKFDNQIDVSKLLVGIYFISLQLQNETSVIKFVKR